MAKGGNPSGQNKRTVIELLNDILSNKRLLAQLITLVLGFSLLVASAFMLASKVTESLTYTILGAGIAVLIQAFLNIVHYQYMKGVEETVENRRLDEIKAQIRDTLVSHLQSCVYKDKMPYVIHKTRNDVKFKELITKAKRRIIVMNTNATFISRYHHEIFEAVEKRNVSFQLLTLNPKNLFIVSRYHELDLRKPKYFYDEMTSSLMRMIGEGKRIVDTEAKKRYEIRLTTKQPTNMIFVVDDTLIVGFILSLGRSSNYVHLEFDLSQSDDSAPELDFYENFKSIWEVATPIDLMSKEIEDLPSDVDLEKLLANGRDNEDNIYAHTYPKL